MPPTKDKGKDKLSFFEVVAQRYMQEHEKKLDMEPTTGESCLYYVTLVPKLTQPKKFGP